MLDFTMKTYRKSHAVNLCMAKETAERILALSKVEHRTIGQQCCFLIDVGLRHYAPALEQLQELREAADEDNHQSDQAG